MTAARAAKDPPPRTASVGPSKTREGGIAEVGGITVLGWGLEVGERGKQMVEGKDEEKGGGAENAIFIRLFFREIRGTAANGGRWGWLRSRTTADAREELRATSAVAS